MLCPCDHITNSVFITELKTRLIPAMTIHNLTWRKARTRHFGAQNILNLFVSFSKEIEFCYFALKQNL